MRLSPDRARFAAFVALALVGFPVASSAAVAQSVAQQAYVKASNTGADDWFSESLSVSGDTMVVGAPHEDSNALGVDGDQTNDGVQDTGAAYVFVRNGSTWSQQAYLKASNADVVDRFGESVSISGDTIVVGAGAENGGSGVIDGNQSDNSLPDAGAAYVFVRNGATWNQQAYIKAAVPSNSYFGGSVAISGDTLAVGAFKLGAAYIFVRSGTTWSQQAMIVGAGSELGDNFGVSVSLSGNTLVVGADQESSIATGVNGNQSDNSANRAGAAYVFVRNGTTWTQQAYLKASNTRAGTYFGTTVSVSGSTVVVGSAGEWSDATGVNGNQFNLGAVNAGAAYAFVRNGTTWSQQAYLKASNTRPGAEFGTWVSVAGNRIAVGARSERCASTGINGNQLAFSANDAGAAYVFQRSGTTWVQEAYVKASNTGAGDAFGLSVSITEDTLVVGARGEASSATGVNGDQTDNSQFRSGAVYAFGLEPEGVSYCFGDGSAGACPCGPGSTGNGCPNSSSAVGAHLGRSGVASTSEDTLALTVTAAIPFAPGVYFQGSANGVGTGFGNGLLCVGGSTPRLEIRFADSLGASSTTVPIHILGSTSGGEVRYYQMCYRDDPAFCTGASFNTTNALSLTWTP